MRLVLFFCLCVFSLTGCDAKDDGAVVGKTLCDFGVVLSDAKLVPVDPHTRQSVGIFERQPDGQIQLTTAEGYAPEYLPN